MTKDKINLICKDLFNSISEKDCLTTIKGKLAYRGKVLDQKQRDIIISQAREIKNMDLFQLLCNEMKYLSNKKMYYESQTPEDILFGKAALWVIDILEKKIDKLSTL